MLDDEVSVLLMHPSKTAFRINDRFYIEHGNSRRPLYIRKVNPLRAEINFFTLETFLSGLALLQKVGLVTITPPLEESRSILSLGRTHIEKLYYHNVLACEKLFNYRPRYMFSHFVRFFDGVDRSFIQRSDDVVQ